MALLLAFSLGCQSVSRRTPERDDSAADATDWDRLGVDRTLEDGDTVTLGGGTMRAHLTPGHTKGWTTWTMTVRENGEEHLVVFVGGTTVNRGVRLLG